MASRYPRRAPKRPSTHSGAILREAVIPALGKSKAEIARRLGVSRQALYNVLSEKAPITPEMAVRIGKLCGNGAGLWVRMQAAHDLWHAEQTVDVSRIETLRAA